ncbi:MAG: hypothetical protein FJW46_06120 [Actinobacteria bacterium]|nr:hypothetical protein [Actinomycetota bacterium]
MVILTPVQNRIDRPKISVEFFPPKDDAGESKLWLTLTQFQAIKLDCASVTYGAGGSTRDRTIRIGQEIT